MASYFRCERCGSLLDLNPGQVAARCARCHHDTKVPAPLLQLAWPHVPPNAVSPLAVTACGSAHAMILQAPVTERLMPWLLSFMFHVSVAVLLLLVGVMVVSAPKVALSTDSDEPTKIPVMDPGHGGYPPIDVSKMGGSLGNEQTIQPMGPQPSSLQLEKPLAAGPAKQELVLRHSSLATSMAMLGSKGRDTSIFGLHRFGNHWGKGHGPGIGDDDGPGSSGGGNIRHIVFVIDRSGSMIESFGQLQAQLLQVLQFLHAPQDFHVVMFASGEPMEYRPRGLVPASLEYKHDAADFILNVSPSGQTDVMPALQRAFKVLASVNDNDGQMICLLTDANFPDSEKVLQMISKLDPAGNVHINTYLFGRPNEEAANVLKRIADEHRGWYNYSSPDE